MHGGYIWVESEVGKGSTFSFVMPVTQGKTAVVYKQLQQTEDTAVSAASLAEPLTAASARSTILIVEDDVATAELLMLQLKESGYHVVHAGDGAEAAMHGYVTRLARQIRDVI